MQRLTGLDASFLYLETATQPLHVCALVTVDPSTIPGGYSFETARRALADRLLRLPEFRRKVHTSWLNLDHPLWVEDQEFDLEHHLHRIAVPPPGGPGELAELCAHIASQPMDRSRPLWEIYLVEGSADGSLAVLAKMHHASVDGVSGANLMSQLAALEPDAPLPEPEERPGSPTPPGALELLADGVRSFARRPVRALRMMPELMGIVPGFVARSLRGEGMRLPFTAPRTPFNRTITARRGVALAQLDLDEIKRVKNAFDVTVNDVVLALCSGALRRYLADRDELPGKPLLASVPVSVHDRTARPEGANKVSAWFASLPTDLDDPVDRLRALSVSNTRAKNHHHTVPADMLQDWARLAGPATFGLAVRAYSTLRLAEKHPAVHNLVISNVPGPPVPIYLLGARVTGMYPLGPVFHGCGLNITVLSLAGQVNVGVVCAAELVPDPWPIVEGMRDELTTLLDAAG
ncbi:wax ester/triacylglycerol synthase family O-acyltransferase [Haloechinothrix sp. LS1_15]|uniref:WS/DGAT/MGAT family O-acyltransferase n=1 Tax=Haloechinothrix sp. LS1_15 TaxID=2652248 RepID=UPI0029475F52|nr:wax ester/triacylglycerol synthase family O-acyltransferase [Haloechinothrix sp. LS1_15]MDV6014194.1 wax ester/triacylglycerol synthase family O-acyltransferase [Haloechinothrix sp. LS1_15]